MNYTFLAEDGKSYGTRAEAEKHGKTVDVIPCFPDEYDAAVKYGPEITGDPQYSKQLEDSP